MSGAAVIKGKCLGSMLIDNMTAVVGDRDAVTQMKLTFSVTSANQVVVLKADSFKDRKEWVERLTAIAEGTQRLEPSSVPVEVPPQFNEVPVEDQTEKVTKTIERLSAIYGDGYLESAFRPSANRREDLERANEHFKK